MQVLKALVFGLIVMQGTVYGRVPRTCEKVRAELVPKVKPLLPHFITNQKCTEWSSNYADCRLHECDYCHWSEFSLSVMKDAGLSKDVIASPDSCGINADICSLFKSLDSACKTTDRDTCTPLLLRKMALALSFLTILICIGAMNY